MYLRSAECASLTTRILHNLPLQSVTGVWTWVKKKKKKKKKALVKLTACSYSPKSCLPSTSSPQARRFRSLSTWSTTTSWCHHFFMYLRSDTWRSRDLRSAECASLTTRILHNGVYSSLFRAKASGGHSKARETRDAQFLQKVTRFALIGVGPARPRPCKCPPP